MYYEVSPAQLMCTAMPNLRRIHVEMLFWGWAVAKNWDRKETKGEGTPPRETLCVTLRLSLLWVWFRGGKNEYSSSLWLWPECKWFSKGPLLKMFSVSSMCTFILGLFFPYAFTVEVKGKVCLNREIDAFPSTMFPHTGLIFLCNLTSRCSLDLLYMHGGLNNNMHVCTGLW